MNKYITGLAFFIGSSVASAQDVADGLQCGEGTNIYFGNGVNTTRERAEDITEVLRATYKSSLEEDETTYEFLTAYNEHVDLAADIFEVFLQRPAQQGTDRNRLTPEQLLALIRIDSDRLQQIQAEIAAIENNTSLTDSFFNIFINDDPLEVKREAELALIGSILGNAALWRLEQTNQNLVQFYRNDLNSGKRVIVIAHSQGNLFALSSVSDVLSVNPEFSGSIGVVGVASPADRTPNSGPYYTANDDLVIDALRQIRVVLPGNVDNDPGVFGDNRDSLNHYFIESYFSTALPSRGLINSAVTQFAANLVVPESTANTGAIRATLEWGAEPDVDLHAFEPDGTQVYYANRVGTYGELDVDDVTSFGPENYFVSCENVGLGDYRIGVNYFSGSAPETARVQLSLADGQVVSRTQSLPSAIGSAGDSSPQIMFTVTVTNIDGDLQFVVD